MQTDRERRKSERIAREAQLEYVNFGLLHSRPTGPARPGRLVNASADGHGVGFVTAHPQFTGGRLLFQHDDAPRTAVVRWVGAVPEGYRVGASVE